MFLLLVNLNNFSKIIPPLGACAHFGACADHGGVFMLGPEQKIGRVYVHHVRKPTYTGLWRALVWMIHQAIF